MKKVFIGALPRNMSEDRLKEVFCSFGEIIDHVVMKDSHTNESRGFGFVEFTTEEAVDALLAARPFQIDGKTIDIRRAMPKGSTQSTIHEKTKRLFIGGMDKSVTEDDVRKYYDEKFSKYGKVESVEIKQGKIPSAKNFGFVSFDSEDAVDAILLKDNRPSVFGHKCEVKKSEPKRGEEGYRKRQRSPDRRGRGGDRRRMDDYREPRDYAQSYADYGRYPYPQEYDGYSRDMGRPPVGRPDYSYPAEPRMPAYGGRPSYGSGREPNMGQGYRDHY